MSRPAGSLASQKARGDTHVLTKQTTILRTAIAAFVAVTAAAAHAQIPIITYHAHENLGYDEQTFREHMEFFVEEGYSTIDMDQFYEWHQNDGPLPLRPVVVTVDDNYIAGYTGMYPIFQELGIVATNYIHTHGIGIGAPKASWAQVREMNDSGHFLAESHSRTHPHLSQVSATQLESEVWGSRQDIADNVGGRVTNHFCYPYGDYNQTVIAEVEAAGYLTAVTTIGGDNYRTTPIYELRRHGGDGIGVATLQQRIGFHNLPPGPPGDGWVLDDESPHCYYDADLWNASTSRPGYYGSRYLYLPEEAGGEADLLHWSAILPETGLMRVHARWTSADNRATDAVYTIETAGDDETVTVNQREGGGEWQELGVFEFAADEPVTVRLGGGSDGVLVADGIWFEPLEPANVEGWMIF